MNKVILSGRTTTDIELKSTSNGTAFCRFNLAVNRNFKNAEGKYDADFFSVQAWRGLAEMLAKNVKKGARVSVVGRLQTSEYEKDGQKHKMCEVVAEDVDIIDWTSTNNNTTSGSGYTEVAETDDVPF